MAATVFDSSQTAHVWAQVRQPSGRSHNGNVFFEGRTLYSYGNHFPLGVISADGVAWLNSDSYSISTTRHQSYAAHAVSHRTRFAVPDLSELRSMLERIGPDGQLPRDARERYAKPLETYLTKNWRAFPETGSDSAAIRLLYVIGSRRTWATMRKGLERAAERGAAAKALAERNRLVEAGKALSGQPIAIVRAEAWIGAADYGQGNLRRWIKESAQMHKATPAKLAKRRAALWLRLKATRAILATADSLSDRNGNASARLKAHAALGRLRKLKAGIGLGTGLPAGDAAREAAFAAPNAYAWRDLASNLFVALAGVGGVPTALRAAAFALEVEADRIATEREGAALQASRLRAVRVPALGALKQFNRDKRFRATGGWMTERGVGPDRGSQIDLLRGMIDSALAINRTADGETHNAQYAPAIVARLKAIQPVLLRHTLAISAEMAPLVEERNAIFEANRKARQERVDRVAAMTPEERAAAWIAGEIERADMRSLDYPVLRAVGAVVDGCKVTGGTLETSQGANVPLRHAFRVFQFVASCRAAGKAWAPGWPHGPARIRVGHFEVDSIDSDGNFVAGCHSIRWQEIAALADHLGVADCLASPAEIATELESEC